jgi:hypothetical protein
MALEHRWVRAVSALALLSCSAVAMAGDDGWSQKVPTGVTVHEHSFERLEAAASGCSFEVKLTFDAPAGAYADKKNLVRNDYIFRARVRLDDGRAVDTNLFFNRHPGKRSYTYRLDTTGDGCWTKEKRKVVKLDVEACRGKRCKVEDF